MNGSLFLEEVGQYAINYQYDGARKLMLEINNHTEIYDYVVSQVRHMIPYEEFENQHSVD